MTARILDYRHWQAARERRTSRERAAMRALYAGRPQRKRTSLDEILGPAFEPNGGAA
tara:strand:- start:2841 stop:3011 length:171 start_codon:yes stop_codon:yes gene_type:complete